MRGSWWHKSALALLLVCGAGAVFFRIGAPSMWVDEAAARAQGAGTIRDLLTQPDTHIRLSHAYLLINRASEALFRDIDIALRAPQALAALISLVFVYLLGRHLFSPGAGLLAVALLIAQPLFIRYAQENRLQQMMSMCMLGMYYCFVRYLAGRSWRALAGLVVLASLALRCGYGVLPVAVLGGMLALVGVARAVAGRARGPYALDGRVVCELLLAGGLIVVLWLPYPWWELQRVLREGIAGNLNRGVAGLDLFYTHNMSAAPGALLALCREYFLVGGSAAAWLLLLVLMCAGSVRYQRGRALLLVLYGVCMTLINFQVMNRAGGGVVPRRYVYLCPLTMLCLAGGVSMAARLGGDLMGALTRRAVWRKGARGCIWLALFGLLIGPQLWHSACQLSQYYYTDRHMYKTAAAVLTAHARAGDCLLYVDTDHRDWTMEHYLPRTLPLARAGTYFIPDPQFVKYPLLTAEILSNLVAQADGVWVTNIDPAEFGIARDMFVRVPCGESMRLGTLALVRRAYARDPAQQLRDTEALLHTIVLQSRYPKIAATRMLADWYGARGATAEAAAVVAQLAQFPVSHAACAALAEYSGCQRGDRLPLTTNVPRVAWIDYTDFGRQAEVCGMADPRVWLGQDAPCASTVTLGATRNVLVIVVLILVSGVLARTRTGARRGAVVATGMGGIALLCVLWLQDALPGWDSACGGAFMWNGLALLVLYVWLTWLYARQRVRLNV